MYCPRCGHSLKQIENKDIRIQSNAFEVESEHWCCTNGKCIFREPCYLIKHHPLRGIDSKPGDSWSLSWVK